MDHTDGGSEPTARDVRSGEREGADRVPWLVAAALGVLVVALFGLWISARSDANEAQVELDRLEEAEQARQAADEALPDLELLARKHRLGTIGAIETINEESLSLNFDGISIDQLGELLEELDFSPGTMSRIGNTRALDGTLTAEAPHVRASWTYHPDDGLSIVLERTG